MKWTWKKGVGALAFVALVVTLALAVRSGPVQAQTGAAATQPITYRYESGSVAAGAIITSPAHLTGSLRRLTIVCDNSLNASTAGTLTIKYLEADCATLAGSFTVSCATSGTNGGFTFVQIASDQPGVSTTGLVQIPVDPPFCTQVSLAAAGSVARQVSVYGRQ